MSKFSLEALKKSFGIQEILRVRFSTALTMGRDPLSIIEYMRRQGYPVEKVEDILAISGDASEEELYAWEVHEGVLVSQQSDSRWLLFER